MMLLMTIAMQTTTATPTSQPTPDIALQSMFSGMHSLMFSITFIVSPWWGAKLFASLLGEDIISHRARFTRMSRPLRRESLPPLASPPTFEDPLVLLVDDFNRDENAVISVISTLEHTPRRDDVRPAADVEDCFCNARGAFCWIRVG